MKDNLNELFNLSRRVQLGENLSEDESDRFLDLYNMARGFVGSIKDDYAASCIIERYINGKTWSEIADVMGQFNEDSVRKSTIRAIQKYS